MMDLLDKRIIELKRKVEAMGDDIVLEKNFNLNDRKIIEIFNLKLLVLILFLLNNMAIASKNMTTLVLLKKVLDEQFKCGYTIKKFFK